MNIDVNGLVDVIVGFALDLIGAILLLIGAWIVSRWAQRATRKSLGKTSLDVTVTLFLANIISWLILVVAVIAVLGVFGVSTASFAAVLGAAGLAVGLAFQGTLSNFAAGVMLLTFRPFKVGDVVKAAGQVGKVEEIDLLVTKLDTPDNRRIVVPNSKVFGDVIETITYHPTRRVDVPVGVDYEAGIDETRAVLEAAIGNIEGCLTEPPAQIFLDSLGDSSVNWIVRVWCNTPDYWAVYQSTTRATKQALDAAGIGIPFPQLDVHFDGAAASS